MSSYFMCFDEQTSPTVKESRPLSTLIQCFILRAISQSSKGFKYLSVVSCVDLGYRKLLECIIDKWNSMS